VGARGPPFVQEVTEAHPQQKVEVWFQDETRVGQQGTLTRRWAPRGSRPTALKQTEYEWVYLFAAVNPITGDSSALLAPTANTEYMNHHLRFISQRVGPNVQVVLVLDRAGWHLSKGLQVPENITLLHLPPYSPQLNPVERLWAYLKSHYLSNRLYENYDHLFRTCGEAWNQMAAEQLSSICRVAWIPRTN
jgi:transposase